MRRARGSAQACHGGDHAGEAAAHRLDERGVRRPRHRAPTTVTLAPRKYSSSRRRMRAAFVLWALLAAAVAVRAAPAPVATASGLLQGATIGSANQWLGRRPSLIAPGTEAPPGRCAFPLMSV